MPVYCVEVGCIYVVYCNFTGRVRGSDVAFGVDPEESEPPSVKERVQLVISRV